MNDNFLVRLYSRPETVFTINEISQIFRSISYKSVRDRLRYYSKTEKLQRIHHGIYAKPSYNPMELANKLYTPSYISLETVLQRAGVTFQYYERIFAVSYLTRTIEVGSHTIQYRRIPKRVLVNTQGITQEGNVNMASPERAFLDAVFLYKNYHFDNVSTLEWDTIMELKDIYPSRVFAKRVKDYYQLYKEDNA